MQPSKSQFTGRVPISEREKVEGVVLTYESAEKSDHSGDIGDGKAGYR